MNVRNLYEKKNDNDTCTPAIRGWLKLFLVVLGIGGITTLIIPIIYFDINHYGNHYFLATLDLSLAAALCTLSFYAIYLFIKRRPNALYIATLYLVVCVLVNILFMLLSTDSQTQTSNIWRFITSFVWAAGWTIFLAYSKQANYLIPPMERRIFRSDYFITLIVIVLPVTLFSIGFVNVTISKEDTPPVIYQSPHLLTDIGKEFQIEEFEYKDNTIRLSLPQHYTIHYQKEENTYVLFDSRAGVSAFVTPNSKAPNNGIYFDLIWQVNKELFFQDLEHQVFQEQEQELPSTTYRIRKSYFDKRYALWQFVHLHDVSTGKSCYINVIQSIHPSTTDFERVAYDPSPIIEGVVF